MQISRNTLIVNVILSVFKLFAGIFANSAAMISDAVHSFSDVMAEIIVMIGIKMSNQESDKDHQYGHERMECVAALILAFILFVIGILIGWNGVQNIISGEYAGSTAPGLLALIAAITSIVVKESMFWYTRAAANKLDSVALRAAAWHHRSDAMSSVGSFVGILGARLGFPILDSVACVVICVCIVKVAIDIFKDAVGKMTDKACDDTIIEEIRVVIMAQPSVIGIDQLQTRLFGNKIYVDIEISINGNTTVYDAHDTAQRVHDGIEARFSNVKHCMVHVNPSKINEAIGEAIEEVAQSSSSVPIKPVSE